MTVDRVDRLGRPLRDLRISVTDRCNFRCVYCMPKEVFGSDYRFLDRKELLTFEEIERVARVFVGLGVNKLRLTGGEPLVRKDVERLIALLAPLGAELTLTTNASLLAPKAAGARRRRARPRHGQPGLARRRDLPAMNDVDFPVQRVLDGIEAAAAAGMPVKVNAVIKRGLNEHAILEMAALLPRHRPHAALHRVHGRRHDERLAARRRRAGRGDRRADLGRVPARAGRARATAARSRSAGATWTAAARSA